MTKVIEFLKYLFSDDASSISPDLRAAVIVILGSAAVLTVSLGLVISPVGYVYHYTTQPGL